ncbi:unnamed protein product, partial [Diabrotica balteata]
CTLIHYLIEHLTLFSDTCGGQNKNIQVSALLLHIVKNHPSLQIIEQKFMESGHFYMECQKKCGDFSVHEYENVFKMARMDNNGNKKSFYNTREVNYNEFLDLKKVAQYAIVNKKEDQKGQTVNWLKVKYFKYEKQIPNIL